MKRSLIRITSYNVCYTKLLRLKTQVLNGNGIAWLPDYSIKQELENNELSIIGSSELVLPISFYAYRYQARLHEAGEKFWNGLTKITLD